VTDTKRPNVTRMLKRGLNEYGLGNLDAAISIWEAVLEIEPENRAAFDYLEAASEEAGYERPKRPRRAPATVSARRRAVSGQDSDDTPRTLDGVVPAAREQPGSSGEGEIQEGLRAYKNGDLDSAYRIFEQLLERDPERLDVEGYLSMIKSKRAKAWVKTIGDQGRILRLNVALNQLRELQLGPEEGFILSQIDGTLSIEQLLSLQQDRVRALEILARLIREEVVA